MSDDIADTVESERFGEIMEMKKRVTEVRDDIAVAKANGRIREGAAIGLFHRKVRDYVISVETVLNPDGGDASRYWNETRIGDFTLPDGEHKDVVGLEGFLELNSVFEIEVERHKERSYRHKRETITEIERVRPPERLIERAFRVTNQALDAAGFDLDEPTDKQKSGFDRVDDVEKATKILDFLRSLDDDGLREVQHLIERDLLADGELTNGHHE